MSWADDAYEDGRFDAALELIKDQFPAYRAIVVVDDKLLRRLVLCWRPSLVRRFMQPTGNTLADLWRAVDVDFEALGRLTSFSQADVLARFEQARGLELIYPDGSLPQEVLNVLMSKLREVKGLD